MFSPLSRSALAVASVEAQAKRRKQRVQRWRERFKRVSLSSAWQESAIVQSVVGMFRMSADVTRMLRASSGSQFVGAGYRQLRMENLEGRQMLSVNVPSMPDLDTASDTGPSTTDNNTNDNTPTFNGTSDANSLVRVGAWVDVNADTVIEDSEVSNIVEAITNGSGNYSATLGTLADGNYQIVAKAYDELGNPSEGSNNGWSNPLSIVIDTAIAATTIDLATASDSVSPNTVLPGTNTDDLTNINTPVFQGTAEPVRNDRGVRWRESDADCHGHRKRYRRLGDLSARGSADRRCPLHHRQSDRWIRQYVDERAAVGDDRHDRLYQYGARHDGCNR